jgi:hypothetical protein
MDSDFLWDVNAMDPSANSDPALSIWHPQEKVESFPTPQHSIPSICVASPLEPTVPSSFALPPISMVDSSVSGFFQGTSQPLDEVLTLLEDGDQLT